VYSRSPLNSTKPLKHAGYPEAYEVWLVEDDGYLPEKDFTVDKSMRIKDLGVDALAFCEVPTF
jgi:hypothetical protein